MSLQILRICSLAGKLPQGVASALILARPVGDRFIGRINAAGIAKSGKALFVGGAAEQSPCGSLPAGERGRQAAPGQIGPIKSQCLVTGYHGEQGQVVLCTLDQDVPLASKLL